MENDRNFTHIMETLKNNENLRFEDLRPEKISHHWGHLLLEVQPKKVWDLHSLKQKQFRKPARLTNSDWIVVFQPSHFQVRASC